MKRAIASSFLAGWPILCLICMAICNFPILPLAAEQTDAARVALPGHVVQSLAKATRVPHAPQMDNEPITLTVVLALSDPAGAKALGDGIADPNSPEYRRTIRPEEFRARFGPSQEAYDTVLGYLKENGLSLSLGSISRRTLTVIGTRAQAQKAFNVVIDDYLLGDRKVHAVASDPAVPEKIAPLILSVFGLSNLSPMQPGFTILDPLTPMSAATAYDGTLTPAGKTNSGGLPPGLDGSGQTIGLIEEDTFKYSDVKNWLKFAGLPAGSINNLSVVPLAGGATPSGCVETDPGCGTTEVLLDIEGAMGIAQGAKIVVFEVPAGTDPATSIGAAGDYLAALSPPGILSTSWGKCEGSIGQSDAMGVDSIIAGLTISGVSTFVFTGDHGADCVDGSGTYTNGIYFPADAPHAIAVGGTYLEVNKDNTYFAEYWWGDGGFGVSDLIPEPSYQEKEKPGASGRSVPDVAMYGAPGIWVCQAESGSKHCSATSGFLVGGTSLATPLWAATWALANQAAEDAGPGVASAGNGFLYNYASGFHSAGSMINRGNNFGHVGLGSPDIAKLIGTLVPIEIDSFSPAGGPAAGDTKVTITGTGFIGIKKVTFGGVQGTNLSIESDTKLTVESPQAPGDQAAIEIETDAGKATASGNFLYTPEIESINPNSGPMEGGASITVKGFGLDTSEQFLFFGVPATSVVCHSATKCTMVTPANLPGQKWVEAQTTWGGDSAITSNTQFFYDPLAINSFTPAIGPTQGGETVYVYGHSFENGKTVFSFGGAPATDVFCVDPNYCYMTSPAQGPSAAVGGKVQITATVGSDVSAPAPHEFKFEVFPTITAISPVPAKAGSTVTITGTGFSTTAGKTTFNFFGINVDGDCASAIQCTAKVPFSSAHSTAVTVTVDGNTSLDWVDFYYPGKLPPPGCKPGACS